MKIHDIELTVNHLDEQACNVAKMKWDSIAKPLHSLGKMEDLLIQIAGISGNPKIDLDKKGLVVMCADNGIVEEGISQSGPEVTALVSENFLSDKATAAILCKKTGADIFPIDIGISVDTKIEKRKVAYGTKNFAKEPAMTREEAEKALAIGIGMVKELSEKGYKILATGEMGIGNTTTSSALAAYFLDREVEEMTGRGAGLTSKGLEKKIQVIKDALKKYGPEMKDPIDALACVGGFDIAGMAGMFLGGMMYRVPIVIDGFISATAALTASKICPECKDFMIASHVSKEPAAIYVLEALEKQAALHCDMCLGEGTGAVSLYTILDLAAEVYHKMSTFDDIELESYVPLV